jgi:hypothetical protein
MQSCPELGLSDVDGMFVLKTHARASDFLWAAWTALERPKLQLRSMYRLPFQATH